SFQRNNQWQAFLSTLRVWNDTLTVLFLHQTAYGFFDALSPAPMDCQHLPFRLMTLLLIPTSQLTYGRPLLKPKPSNLLERPIIAYLTLEEIHFPMEACFTMPSRLLGR